PELPLIRLLRRSRWQRVDRPGGHAPVARPHRSRNDDLCVGQRSGKRDAARGSRPRRAREARRTARRELAGLVCSVHGGGAGRERTADVNDDVLVTGQEKETAINEKNDHRGERYENLTNV